MRPEAVAYIIVIGALIVGAAVLLRVAGRRSAAPGPKVEKVPAALRPGDPDDVLESDRLGKIQWLGAAMSIAFAAFIAIYWLQEAGRMRGKEELFLEISVERGAAYYQAGEGTVEGAAVLGLDCARCHGENLEGGENTFFDPTQGAQRTVAVPELRGVFARYDTAPPGYRDAEEYITATIERGRTDGVIGVPYDMPNWSNQYGGPLTEQQIADLVNFLKSVQGTGGEGDGAEPTLDGKAIFDQNCAPCHGIGGAGGVGPAFVGGGAATQFPDIEDHIEFVKMGSQRGAPYGTSGQGTGGMPPWQGRLTEEQIRAVVEYERGL